MSELRVIITDILGTICGFGNSIAKDAFVNAFRQKGIDLSLEENKQHYDKIAVYMGRKKIHHAELIYKSIQRQYPCYYTHQDLVDIDKEIENYIASNVSTIKIISGVEDLMNLKHEIPKLKIATTTGFTTKSMNDVLQNLKKQGFHSDYNIASDNVQNPRPAPDMIYSVCNHFGVSPRHCINIDDSYVGTYSGFSAGVWTIQPLMSGDKYSAEDYEKMPDEEKSRIFSQLKQNIKAENKAIADYNVPTIKEAVPCVRNIQNLIRSGMRFIR